MTTRATCRVLLLWGMALLLAAYVAGLAASGDSLRLLVDGWLGILTQWVPAAVCWAALKRSKPSGPVGRSAGASAAKP